jgi:hypothetical protein
MLKKRLAPMVCCAAAIAAVPALASATSSQHSPHVSAAHTETLHAYDVAEKVVLTGPISTTPRTRPIALTRTA